MKPGLHTLRNTHDISSLKFFQQLWCWQHQTQFQLWKNMLAIQILFGDSALYHIAISTKPSNYQNPTIHQIYQENFMLHWWSVFVCVCFSNQKKTYSTCFLPLSPGRPNPRNMLGIPCIVGGRPPCRFSHHHVLISLPKAWESTYLAIFFNISPTHLDFPKKIEDFQLLNYRLGLSWGRVRSLYGIYTVGYVIFPRRKGPYTWISYFDGS